MQLRPGTGGDRDAVLAVLAAAGVEEPARLGDGLADADAVLVVADEGEAEALSGAAFGRLAEPDLLRASAVVVHPERRRRGLGGALLDGLADAAFERGARRIEAQAAGADQRAFLLACGLRTPDGSRYVGELEPRARVLVVRGSDLRLGQLLKLAGLAETGTDAKALLAAAAVEVNGEVETRRGRQLADGDVVATAEQAVRLVFEADAGPAQAFGGVDSN